jgi:hypothetical protein
VCGFEYNKPPLPSAGNCFWGNIYRYKDFYIYYNNTGNFIFAEDATETNDAGIPPLHNSCIDNINIDIIKETLKNAGIEVKDEFVPTFRKGDKLICVDDRSTNEVKINEHKIFKGHR